MILALAEDCPLFQPDNEAHLHRLLYSATLMRWHIIANPRPDRMRHLLPPHILRLYGEFLIQSQKAAINSMQTWARHPNCGSCDPEKVANFYNLPCALIVENRHTDGAWIKLVAQLLRPRLSQAFRPLRPRISIQQAGGIGEIPKEVRETAPEYRKCHPGGNVPLCVMAVSDSDASGQGAISTNAREVEKAAAEVGATVHVLQKRSIENYVPDDALVDFVGTRADRRNACEQILALPRAERDYYPMKDHMGEFMDDVLKNFSYAISASGLRTRDGMGELEELLDKLESNL